METLLVGTRALPRRKYPPFLHSAQESAQKTQTPKPVFGFWERVVSRPAQLGGLQQDCLLSFVLHAGSSGSLLYRALQFPEVCTPQSPLPSFSPCDLSWPLVPTRSLPHSHALCSVTCQHREGPRGSCCSAPCMEIGTDKCRDEVCRAGQAGELLRLRERHRLLCRLLCQRAPWTLGEGSSGASLPAPRQLQHFEFLFSLLLSFLHPSPLPPPSSLLPPPPLLPPPSFHMSLLSMLCAAH